MYIDGTPRLNASQRIRWAFCTELTCSARFVAEVLDGAPRKLTETWMPVPAIAERLGLSNRTVQRTLKELEQKGFIEFVSDGSLKTHRSIKLLWRNPSQAAPNTKGPSDGE